MKYYFSVLLGKFILYIHIIKTSIAYGNPNLAPRGRCIYSYQYCNFVNKCKQLDTQIIPFVGGNPEMHTDIQSSFPA